LSTDGTAFGLWERDAANSFIERLLFADRLRLDAVPIVPRRQDVFADSAKAELFVEGLRDEIGPLRASCPW